VDHVLSLLGETRRSAVARYVDLVDGSSGETYDTTVAVDQAVMGDDGFAVAQWEASAPSQPTPRRRALSLERILDAVARDAGFTIEDLRSGRRGGAVAAARCRAVWVARQLCGVSVRRVALRLGRDDSSFVRPLAKLGTQLDSDTELRSRLDRLVRSLDPPPAER
jgi:hypothetical protein